MSTPYTITIRFDGAAYKELIEDGSLDGNLLDAYLKNDAEYACKHANLKPMAAAILAGDTCEVTLNAFDNER